MGDYGSRGPRSWPLRVMRATAMLALLDNFRVT